jgi:predicted type IV restriction endonuclease
VPDFAERISKLAQQILSRKDHIQGEEATKQALILPWIAALGYDIYDPTEVRPEFIADFTKRKNGQKEKVDYALFKNGAPAIFIEAKAVNGKARAHDGQLQRYFNANPSAKVAIITNGLEYHFFTDLNAPNIMDSEPFFTFNILEFHPEQLATLSTFRREHYTAESIVGLAEEMNNMQAMTKLVSAILRDPPESFVRYLLAEVGYAQRITSRVVGSFQPIIKRAVQTSLVDFMAQSIGQQIATPIVKSVPIITVPEPIVISEPEPIAETRTMTEEEQDAFERVKRIVAKSALQKEVYARVVSGYMAVDFGKASSWFLRFVINARRKSIITRLEPDEAASLASGFDVKPVPDGMGGSQIVLNSITDLAFLRPLIVRCYESVIANTPSLEQK